MLRHTHLGWSDGIGLTPEKSHRAQLALFVDVTRGGLEEELLDSMLKSYVQFSLVLICAG
jgi:hypothetical protein